MAAQPCPPAQTPVLERTLSFIVQLQGGNPKYYNMQAIAEDLRAQHPLCTEWNRADERTHFEQLLDGDWVTWERPMKKLFKHFFSIICPWPDCDPSLTYLLLVDGFALEKQPCNPLYEYYAEVAHRLGHIATPTVEALGKFLEGEFVG